MINYSRICALGLAGAATLFTAPVMAASVPNGTVTVGAFYAPTVDLMAMPSTYKVTSGATFEVIGTGGFVPVTGLMGTMNGTLSFSNVVGVTLAQSLANFFVFNDGAGGTYNFSVDSVRTDTMMTSAASNSLSLYILGSTIDSHLNYAATPTSLTLGFNSTGGSPYSTSATLSVPPASMAPEPVTWALMVGGFGAVGMALRRRPRLATAL